MLNEEDCNVIGNNEMLNDNHIYKFQELLEVESGGIMQMQNSTYLQMLDEIKPIDKSKSHIQILFSGSYKCGHWICSYYDKNVLFIYDSLNNKCLNEDQRKFLSRLYPFKPKVVFRRVQQQPNSVDCGVYAIAFATSLYFNIEPENVVYNHALMRNHLYEMFNNNVLLHFPIITNDFVKPLNLNIEKVDSMEIVRNVEDDRQKRNVGLKNIKEKQIKENNNSVLLYMKEVKKEAPTNIDQKTNKSKATYAKEYRQRVKLNRKINEGEKTEIMSEQVVSNKRDLHFCNRKYIESPLKFSKELKGDDNPDILHTKLSQEVLLKTSKHKIIKSSAEYQKDYRKRLKLKENIKGEKIYTLLHL